MVFIYQSLKILSSYFSSLFNKNMDFLMIISFNCFLYLYKFDNVQKVGDEIKNQI